MQPRPLKLQHGPQPLIHGERGAETSLGTSIGCGAALGAADTSVRQECLRQGGTCAGWPTNQPSFFIGPSGGVHLLRDLIEQSAGVIGDFIKVKVRSIRDKGEMGIGIQ
jgi:hypothetical protein